MTQPQLRVYFGSQQRSDETSASERTSPPQDKVSVPLQEVLPVLADAVRNERSWLHDFDEEEITISTDLYEVILAYQHYRRAS